MKHLGKQIKGNKVFYCNNKVIEMELAFLLFSKC